jgi:Zn-dependent M28 family amino/carboxypeptidase
MRATPRASLPRFLRAGSSLLLLATSTLLSCAPSPQEAWWSHVRWLADDARRGRETGEPGYFAAAQYVAHEFERAGAKPAGIDGYFQPVRFVWRKLRESDSWVALARGDRADTLELGEEMIVSDGIDTADSVDAEAVFVGYGLQLPEANLDDLAGQDLHGKLLIYLRGAPKSLPSTVAAHAQSGGYRWSRMKAAGATGTISISDPSVARIPWARIKASRGEPGMTLADSALDERKGIEFSASVNPAHAEKMFEGSGHTFAEILDAAHGGRPMPHFKLPYKIRARVRVDRRNVESPNVIGIMPGSDPALRGESIVLTAHLDHLGVGGPIAGDSIYNGAMDNASGVATLIEIARAVHSMPHPPRRSIVLLALTGEEKGLLGSYAFANHPPPAVGHMVANLNLDMFLPIVPLKSVIAYGIDESELGDWFRAIADSAGVRIQPDPEPEQNIFVRSDQYNLVRAGVPALFMEFGQTGDSTLDKRFKVWRRDRYHAPSDDVNQPVNKDAAVAFNNLLLRTCLDVANRPGMPRWKADSFFRRYAKDPSMIAPPSAGSAPHDTTRATG